VSGGPEVVDAPAAQLSLDVDAVVVSVGHRLAPERPQPAALNDSYRALQWSFGAAGVLGIDPGRIGLAGDSDGARLAAGLALLARDRHGPQVRFLCVDTSQPPRPVSPRARATTSGVRSSSAGTSLTSRCQHKRRTCRDWPPPAW
jgi:acetyl esterase/lipase